MTVAQYIALGLAGPLALMQLTHLALTLRGKAVFDVYRGVLLGACVVALLLAFVGVK